MNIALSDTILYVTGKQGIENSTEQELQTIVAEYPYFAPAHLVYAAKLKSENSFKLQTQIQKAGLFFNNFKWLQYQLLEVNVGNFNSSIVANNGNHQKSVIEGNQITEEITNGLIKEEVNTVAEPVEMKGNTPFTQYDVAETIPSNVNSFMSNMSIPTIEDIKGIMNGIDEKKEDVKDEIIAVAKEETAAIEAISPVLPINENIGKEVVEEINANDNEEGELTAEPIITGFEVDEPIIIEDAIATPANDIHAQIASLKANWYTQQKAVAEEIVEQKPTTAIHSTPTENNIATDLAAIKKEFNKPVESLANEPLPFETEPYYTIDYFASQGIKFDYTKDPQDKLTAKMLKFTDWLKKMKSPKPEINITVDDPELDKAIQNIAAASNQSKEIITETMAEIFAKQGKTDKAIQLYIKLSFLIPDKSAYFATKLKELKGI
jgi:hypothetical protein